MPKIPLWFHFDNGADVNVINQSFALANDLESVEAPLPSSQWMDGNTIFYYTAYLVNYELQDSWRYMKQCQHIFYAIAKHDNPLMVIGMPAMTDKQIKLDIAKHTWQFGVVAKALEMLPLQEFAETLTKEILVYALLVLGVDINKGQRVYALKTDASCTNTDDDTAPRLLDKLKEYKDVFLTEEAGCLCSHEGRDHAIEITADPCLGRCTIYRILS